MTPFLIVADNSTVRLDLDNEPQPDLLLCIEKEAGGQSLVDFGGYITGTPELVVEIAALLQNNLSKVLEVLQQGLATTEHQTFVEGLTKKVEENNG